MGSLKTNNTSLNENSTVNQLFNKLGDLSYKWFPDQEKIEWDGNPAEFLNSLKNKPLTSRSAWYSVIHLNDLGRVRSLLEKSVQNRVPYSITYRVRGQLGYFPILDKGLCLEEQDSGNYQSILLKLPVESESGSIKPLAGNQDLILKELVASKVKLDNIIKHSTSLFYTHSPEGEITYVSPQCRDYLDCEPEEAMGRWQEFTTDNPENEEGIELTTKAIQTRQKQAQYFLELISKKGRKLWVKVDESPVVEDGKTIAIVGSLTDVTQQRVLKDSLQASNKELKEINTQLAGARDELFAQRELLNNIIENLPVGLQVFDEKGYSQKFNKKQQEILGLSNLDEGIGKFNVLTDPYSKANGSDKRYQGVYNGELVEHEFEFNFGINENNWKTREDQRILQETIFPVFDARHVVSHVVALLADVTTQRKNEKLIKENEEKLRQVVESSPIGIVLMTPDGKALTYNKKFNSLFG